MKKKILLISSVVILMLMSAGCTKVDNYAFVNYGINKVSNELIKSNDGYSVAWVSQEQNGEKVTNRIWSADKNGKNLKELISMELNPEKTLRIMGYYPESNIFIYAIEYNNPIFGPKIQRETFYKFFNEEAAHNIGSNYLKFFKTDKGVLGLRVGDVLAYYQLSMNNSYAIDSKSSYSKDKKIIALFTDAQTTPDLKKVIYTFEYDPATQGYNQNKLMMADFIGENRKELTADSKNIEILSVENNKVRAKVGGEEKEFTF